VTDGQLALIDFFIDNQSPDVSVFRVNGPGGLDFTRINILTTGYYELSYDLTWAAFDITPPVQDFWVFLTAHGGSTALCSNTVLATSGPRLGFQRQRMTEASFYPVSGTHIGFFEAGACIALRALEADPTSGNDVRLDQAQVVIKRLR